MERAILISLLCLAQLALGQDDPFAAPQSESEKLPDETFKEFTDPRGQDYFPRGRASYYTRYLAAMNEPSVMAPLGDGVETIYRFTYLRSFDDPLVIRLTAKGGVFAMRSVKLKMDREYRPVKITYDQTTALNDEESSALAILLGDSKLWEDLNENEIALMDSIMDGSTWIYEKHDKTGYSMFEVRSPRAIAEFAAEGTFETTKDFLLYVRIGEQLLRKGAILPDEKDRY